MRIAVIAVAGLMVGSCQWVPGTDAYLQEQGKKAAAALLRDPSSAQFRNVSLHRMPEEAALGDHAVCGEVNGKNAHGAYAGFGRFIANPQNGHAELDPQTGTRLEDLQAATEKCRREVASARRSGFVELARFECDQTKEVADSFELQRGFDAAYEMFCEIPQAEPPGGQTK